MKTLHLDPTAAGQTALVTEEIDRLLSEGKRLAVTLAEEQEFLSPQQVADRLGFSRQHAVRLIGYGDLPAEKLPGSSYWKIPLASVLAFEEERDHARELTAQWSRDLDAMGLTADAAQRWVNHLPENFPDGRVQIAQVLASTDFSSLTTDPEDHHVCALAIASRARYLFTHDRGYLQDGLGSYGVEVIAPDTFLAAAFDAQPRGIRESLELQAGDWVGGQPIEELLAAIERAGATVFANKARRTVTM
jgi:excisionase family DNA binding protein